MQYTTLGKTGLRVSRTSFGALPIQRVGMDDAARILRHAYEKGINFFDTARVYTDSEEKIAYALGDVRAKIIIATKAMVSNLEELKISFDTSLSKLKTNYVDIFQFHNPKSVITDDMYAYVADLKQQGVIRHIGVTNHSLERVKDMLRTGLFETVQFPLSSLSAPEELEFAEQCAKDGIGFIAMKAMAGGLIRHVRENFAFLRTLENAVPIWGIQHMSELEEFLALEEESPRLTPEMERLLEGERERLKGSFCRSCGYCQPCPAEIPLENACRMDMLLGRAVYQSYLTPEWQEKMSRIEKCTDCGACDTRCPYQLKPRELARKQYEFYRRFAETHREA